MKAYSDLLLCLRFEPGDGSVEKENFGLHGFMGRWRILEPAYVSSTEPEPEPSVGSTDS